jgi:hypothetical protein
VKLYSIPPCLVVNIDQIEIHLVPTVGERSWENKGSKHIQVLGVEDKRQVTLVVSFATNGNLLPGQVVFTCTTFRCLPPLNEGNLKKITKYIQQIIKRCMFSLYNKGCFWPNV